MLLKTITWNIGGAKALAPGKDPLSMSSYNIDAVHMVAKYLKAAAPDIVCLQEVQGNADSDQVTQIARIMGYDYYFYDAVSLSHIDDGDTLGNGIISKHPIANHQVGMFLNPNIEVVFAGVPQPCKDKGYSRCDVRVGDKSVQAVVLHLLPFGSLGIDVLSDVGKGIRASVEDSLLTSANRVLIQGDFNINSQRMAPYFPNLFKNMELHETSCPQPTTPRGHRNDHVLYKGLTLQSVIIDESVTLDHYPVICVFEA